MANFLGMDGRVAIVTGAATGIGEAIARRLAAAGAIVVVADLNAKKAWAVAESLGGGAYAVEVDVADAGSIERAVREVLRGSQKIDVLVNNAGTGGRAAPIWEQTEEE